MIDRYCVLKTKLAQGKIPKGICQNITDDEVIDLYVSSFPEGVNWSKYPGIRSIKVFEHSSGIYCVSYVIVGSGEYGLKLGQLQAWIILLKKEFLAERLKHQDWILRLYTEADPVFSKDQNYAEFKANMDTFKETVSFGPSKVTKNSDGLRLPYPEDGTNHSSPAEWKKMEEAVWELVYSHLRRTGEILPFTTFCISMQQPRPYGNVIIGFPSNERDAQPIKIRRIPKYMRGPLIIGLIVLCLMLSLLANTLVSSTTRSSTPTQTATLTRPPTETPSASPMQSPTAAVTLPIPLTP